MLFLNLCFPLNRRALWVQMGIHLSLLAWAFSSVPLTYAAKGDRKGSGTKGESTATPQSGSHILASPFCQPSLTPPLSARVDGPLRWRQIVETWVPQQEQQGYLTENYRIQASTLASMDGAQEVDPFTIIESYLNWKKSENESAPGIFSQRARLGLALLPGFGLIFSELKSGTLKNIDFRLVMEFLEIFAPFGPAFVGRLFNQDTFIDFLGHDVSIEGLPDIGAILFRSQDVTRALSNLEPRSVSFRDFII